MNFNGRLLLETLKFTYIGNDEYKGKCKILINDEIFTLDFTTNSLLCNIETDTECTWNSAIFSIYEPEIKMILPFLRKNDIFFTITKEKD